MGLLDLKARTSPPCPATDVASRPIEATRGEPQADRKAPVIRTTDSDKDRARIGLTMWNDREPFIHYCQVCGAWGAFGFEVDLLKGRLGRWYCLEHKPETRHP